MNVVQSLAWGLLQSAALLALAPLLRGVIKKMKAAFQSRQGPPLLQGYYDLATPYFATKYTLNHLALDAAARTNIHTGEYPVGHMVYLEKGVLAQLKTDVAAFIADALATEGKPHRG